MTISDKKEEKKPISEDKNKTQDIKVEEKLHSAAKEETVEDKLKNVEEKLLRSMAEL